jgi:hypothetical protein
MLRPYFLHHRELLGEMARIAYDTVREMMTAAVEVPRDPRPSRQNPPRTQASSSRELKLTPRQPPPSTPPVCLHAIQRAQDTSALAPCSKRAPDCRPNSRNLTSKRAIQLMGLTATGYK